MPSIGRRTRSMLLCVLLASSAAAQHDEQSLAKLVTRGEITLQGQTLPYVIRHLPPASFPGLPDAVEKALEERECLIPQTYEAHRPENVVRGSFARPGSSDWAVLCSAQGRVSLLVFFAESPATPAIIASDRETSRLQAYSSTRVLGFNWGIDVATPEAVHEAQIGLSPRPPRLDHDAVADSVVDRKTTYRYFKNGAWSKVELPD